MKNNCYLRVYYFMNLGKLHSSCSMEAEPGMCCTPYRTLMETVWVVQVLNVSKYAIMTGSLVAFSQVPNCAEKYYFIKIGAQERSLTMILAAASIITWSW